MLATESSLRCKVSEHSSADTTIATWSGKPRKHVCGADDASHSTGASQAENRRAPDVRTHPEAVDDSRVEAGVAIPVPVTKKRWSTSRGVIPAVSSALRAAVAPNSGSLTRPGGVGLGERVERRVLAHRQRQVAPIDPHRALDLLEGRTPAARLSYFSPHRALSKAAIDCWSITLGGSAVAAAKMAGAAQMFLTIRLATYQRRNDETTLAAQEPSNKSKFIIMPYSISMEEALPRGRCSGEPMRRTCGAV